MALPASEDTGLPPALDAVSRGWFTREYGLLWRKCRTETVERDARMVVVEARARARIGLRTVGCVPRHPKKPRRLLADGRAYLWTLRHSHGVLDDGRSTGCRETLTLYPQPAGSGGPLRVVFTEGPGRYVPGGAPLGSGDVGYLHGGALNLHEPGAVRALLDAALARGWQPTQRRPVEVDGWPLLEAATADQAGDAGPAGR